LGKDRHYTSLESFPECSGDSEDFLSRNLSLEAECANTFSAGVLWMVTHMSSLDGLFPGSRMVRGWMGSSLVATFN